MVVSSIFGNYLVKKNLITQEQLKDVLNEQKKVRVKLGLIAVAEGLMSKEDADRVNRLQAQMDKRFGDIAISKGYLTEGQVETLLKKQGSAYLSFVQALENLQLMSLEQLEQYLIDFRCENNLTVSDVENIKSNDIDRILPIYLPVDADKYLPLAGIALRTLMRLVDTKIYPEKAYITSELEADNGAFQNAEGGINICCGMAGRGEALLYTASVFGQEEFAGIDEDALDSVAELVNCVNGLHASSLSKEGISVDLLPPEYSVNLTKVTGKEMLVLPLNIHGSEVYFLIAIDNKIEMN